MIGVRYMLDGAGVQVLSRSLSSQDYEEEGAEEVLFALLEGDPMYVNVLIKQFTGPALSIMMEIVMIRNSLTALATAHQRTSHLIKTPSPTLSSCLQVHFVCWSR